MCEREINTAETKKFADKDTHTLIHTNAHTKERKCIPPFSQSRKTYVSLAPIQKLAMMQPLPTPAIIAVSPNLRKMSKEFLNKRDKKRKKKKREREKH